MALRRNEHFLLIFSLALSLAVLWYVDWRLPTVHLAPLAALPLFIMAYRIGLWPTIPLACAAAIALAVADHDASIISRTTFTDVGVDSAMLLVAFGVVAIAADRMREREQQVVRLRERVVKERHRAEHDTVTGLPNRAHFEKHLDQSADVLGASAAVGVVVIDIDNFKEINDSRGHRVGDRVLREVGRRLAAEVRSSDTVARIGGDEFGLILRGVATVQDVQKVCADLQVGFATPIVLGSQTVPVGVSVGYSMFPDDGDNLRTLVDVADKRMYRAKATPHDQRAAT